MFNVDELRLIKKELENNINTEKQNTNKGELNTIINKINDIITKTNKCKESLWKFYWDYGRSWEVEGVFKATKEDVERLIGYEVYFGEILGKHSEVGGIIEEGEITLLSDDPLKVLQSVESGYNPLEYVRDIEFYICDLNIDELKRFAMFNSFEFGDKDIDNYNEDEIYDKILEICEDFDVDELKSARKFALSKDED